MAVTPKKKSILDALKTQLETQIDGTGNYANNISTASRRIILPESKAPVDYPYLIIIPQEDLEYEPLTNTEYTTGTSESSVTDGWLIDIYGYLQVATDIDDAGTLQDAQYGLESDIQLAIASDITINSTALCTTVIRSQISRDWQGNIGGINVTICIKYDFNPSVNP